VIRTRDYRDVAQEIAGSAIDTQDGGAALFG